MKHSRGEETGGRPWQKKLHVSDSPNLTLQLHVQFIVHHCKTLIAPMAEAARQTVRRWVMTVGVSAVVIAGTISGARLKDEQDVKKVSISLSLTYLAEH